MNCVKDVLMDIVLQSDWLGDIPAYLAWESIEDLGIAIVIEKNTIDCVLINQVFVHTLRFIELIV